MPNTSRLASSARAVRRLVAILAAAFTLDCTEPPATAPTPAEAVPMAPPLSQTLMEVKRVIALMADLELYQQSTRQPMQESTERLRTIFPPDSLKIALRPDSGASATRGGDPGSRSYDLRGGFWLDSGAFVRRRRYVVGGMLSDQPPARVDSIIDLAGAFVVPPFRNFHGHGSSDGSEIEAELGRDFRPGIYFVRALDGDVVFAADDRADLARAWSRLLASHPDVVKVYRFTGDGLDDYRRASAGFDESGRITLGHLRSRATSLVLFPSNLVRDLVAGSEASFLVLRCEPLARPECSSAILRRMTRGRLVPSEGTAPVPEPELPRTTPPVTQAPDPPPPRDERE